MTSETTCLKCGAPLTGDARQGFCPKCLFAQARHFDEFAIEGEIGPDLPRPFGQYELIEEVARGCASTGPGRRENAVRTVPRNGA